MFSNLSLVWDLSLTAMTEEGEEEKETEVLWNAGRRKDCKSKLVLAPRPEPLREPQDKNLTCRLLSGAYEAHLTGGDKPHLPWEQELPNDFRRGSSQEYPWWRLHRMPDWLIQACCWPFRAEKTEVYFTNVSLLFPWMEVITKYDSADKWFLPLSVKAVVLGWFIRTFFCQL